MDRRDDTIGERPGRRGETLPEELAHYTASGDKNIVLYHNAGDGAESRIDRALREARIALAFCGDRDQGWEERAILIRVLREQTVLTEDGSLRLRTAEDGGMGSDMLQNPADIDMTYRMKNMRSHWGYVGDVVEAVREEGRGVIIKYEYEPNNVSDAEFAKRAIETAGDRESTVTLVTDGAYGGAENAELAAEHNVELVTRNLTGKKPPEILGDFEFSEDGSKVVKCPAANISDKSVLSEKTGNHTIFLAPDKCANCPHKDERRPKIYKKGSKKTVSRTTCRRASQVRNRKTEEFSNHCHFRNAVEGLPSLLRRKYGVDAMPAPGLAERRIFFGAKIAAISVVKF